MNGGKTILIVLAEAIIMVILIIVIVGNLEREKEAETVESTEVGATQATQGAMPAQNVQENVVTLATPENTEMPMVTEEISGVSEKPVEVIKIKPTKKPAKVNTAKKKKPKKTEEPEDTEESEDTEIYVVVDLSEQHLWVYQGKKTLLETNVVTGTANTGRATPTGTYKIYGKTPGKYLRGPGYKCWVDYWMPFNGNIGLHDASWRAESEFEPERYLSDGSHGCVNLLPKVAEEIYGLVSVGTRVEIQE